MGIRYRPAGKPKSAIYGDALPSLNAHLVELLDHPRLVAQLCGLERRTSRGGRDSIDHAPHGHDDLSNAACGVLADLLVHAPGADGGPVPMSGTTLRIDLAAWNQPAALQPYNAGLTPRIASTGPGAPEAGPAPSRSRRGIRRNRAARHFLRAGYSRRTQSMMAPGSSSTSSRDPSSRPRPSTGAGRAPMTPVRGAGCGRATGARGAPAEA